MPRGERPLGPGDRLLVEFARDLRRLRQGAGLPTYRELSARAHFSAAALSAAAGGRKLPSLAVTVAYVAACGGDVAEWEARWQHVAAQLTIPTASGSDSTRTESDTGGGSAPYVGLAAFQPADADRFFGRDGLVSELVARVRERRFLGVFGPSGCGKSSVLRAGLVAQLTAQPTARNGRCPVVVFTPGQHPLEECAVQLARLLGHSPAALRAEFAADAESLHLRVRQILADYSAEADLVVVVDQFEEVFTLCGQEDERAQFIDVLVTAATARTSRARVVLGVRADFYGHCAQYPRLVEALRDGQVMVGPMTADDLRQAITQPAERAGYRVESALVVRVIADAAGQPGVLPLVSHALLETWRRRRGTTLTLIGYQTAGGIHHALAHTAEAAYARLDTNQQAVARQIFLRLTALGDGTEDTKRRISRWELDADNPDTAVVLDRLAAARLVTLDRDTIELAHEALIRHWPRLRDWLAADRESLRIHRELTDAANIWQSLDRDPSALYRGARLAIADNWISGRGELLSTREREFLDTSRSAQAREQFLTLRRTRRLRRLVALLAVLLLVATVAIGFAVRAQQAATQQRNAALARTVLSEATTMRATNPALALQLAVAAYRLEPTKAARDTLYEMFATPYATRLADHPGGVFGLAISQDGRLLVTATLGPKSPQIAIRDISDPFRPRDLSTLPAMATSAAFSPDGRILATAQSQGLAQLWDLTDPEHPQPLADLGDFGDLPLGIGSSVTVSPDGRVLAAAGADRTVRLWNIEDPRHPAMLATLPGGTDTGDTPGIGTAVAFSPDGHTLATTARDHTARLWDLADPRNPTPLGILAGHAGSVCAVGFHPSAPVVATASCDKTIRLWNVADPRDPTPFAHLTGHSGEVLAVAFSHDGHTLATASEDRTTRLWNVTDPAKPTELTVLTGHTDVVRAVIFSPDDRTLVTGSGDRTVRLEDLSHVALTSHGESVISLVFSPKGSLAATSSGDKTLRLWDFNDRHRPRQLATLHLENEVSTPSFSSDGRILATALPDKVQLWDVDNPNRPTAMTSIQTNGLGRAAFSPKEPVLAVTTAAGTQLLDVSDPGKPRKLGSSADRLVAFSPDGQMFTTSTGTMLRRWDITDAGNPRIAGIVPTVADSVAFGRSGQILATTGFDDEYTRLWDISQPQQPTELTAIPSGANGKAAFSPDGLRLVTNGADKTARIWDITDPRHTTEVTTLRGHAAEVSAVAFSPDGSTIVTGDEDHIIRLWDTDIERVAARACAIAHPRITTTEWAQHFPGLNYQPPCP